MQISLCKHEATLQHPARSVCLRRVLKKAALIIKTLIPHPQLLPLNWHRQLAWKCLLLHRDDFPFCFPGASQFCHRDAAHLHTRITFYDFYLDASSAAAPFIFFYLFSHVGGRVCVCCHIFILQRDTSLSVQMTALCFARAADRYRGQPKRE